LKPVIIIAIAFVLLIPLPVFGEISDEPKVYKVKIQLHKISDVNLETRTFDAAFDLFISREDGNFTTEILPEMEFINGKDVSEKLKFLEPNFIKKHVEGTFEIEDIDYRNFPFYSLDLEIMLEPKKPHTVDYVNFSIDPSLEFPDIRISGYVVENQMQYVTHMSYLEGNFSRFTTEFDLTPPFQSSFMTTIFPILVVMGVGYVAYMFPKRYDLQAALVLLPLAAVVFLQIEVLRQIPALPFMTLFDIMMAVIYVLIMNNVISIGRQIRADEHTSGKTSWQVSRFHLKISPIIAIVLLVLLLTLGIFF